MKVFVAVLALFVGTTFAAQSCPTAGDATNPTGTSNIPAAATCSTGDICMTTSEYKDANDATKVTKTTWACATADTAAGKTNGKCMPKDGTTDTFICYDTDASAKWKCAKCEAAAQSGAEEMAVFSAVSTVVAAVAAKLF